MVRQIVGVVWYTLLVGDEVCAEAEKFMHLISCRAGQGNRLKQTPKQIINQ
jgi:hypothetical protein